MIDHDQSARTAARDLIAASWRPGEDMSERRHRLIAETAAALEARDRQLAHEREELQDLTNLVAEKLRVEKEIATTRLAAANAILDADKARRALDQSVRRAEIRAVRAGQRPQTNVMQRHINIDPSAWRVLGAEAKRCRTTLQTLAGEVLTEEGRRRTSGEVTGHPAVRRRRSPGEGEPHPIDRVARLLITEDSWATITNIAALDSLTTARYAGEVLEALAHELGWRASSLQIAPSSQSR